MKENFRQESFSRMFTLTLKVVMGGEYAIKVHRALSTLTGKATYCCEFSYWFRISKRNVLFHSQTLQTILLRDIEKNTSKTKTNFIYLAANSLSYPISFYHIKQNNKLSLCKFQGWILVSVRIIFVFTRLWTKIKANPSAALTIQWNTPSFIRYRVKSVKSPFLFLP